MGQYRLLVRVPKAEDDFRVTQNIDRKALLKTVKSMGQVQVQSGIFILTFMSKWKPPNATQMKNLIDAVVQILTSTTPFYEDTCEECGRSSSNVVLLEGIPRLQCSSCLDKLQQEVKSAEKHFEAAKPNYKKGIALATGAALVSAVVWGLIAYVFETFFFFAGFLIGLFVGYTLAYGTKKITGGVIGIAISLTLFAVILGEVLFVTFVLLGYGIPLGYLPEAFALYVTEYTGEFIASIVAGLIGAGYVAYYLWSRAKRQRETFDVVS
ncbi:MAG: hypothetical protein JSV43_07005, partial [Methanobacteriota archaeon]